VDFVEIYKVYVGKMVIKAAKRIFDSDKICRSYSDLNFGVTFFGTQCIRNKPNLTTDSRVYILVSVTFIILNHYYLRQGGYMYFSSHIKPHTSNYTP